MSHGEVVVAEVMAQFAERLLAISEVRGSIIGEIL